MGKKNKYDLTLNEVKEFYNDSGLYDNKGKFTQDRETIDKYVNKCMSYVASTKDKRPYHYNDRFICNRVIKYQKDNERFSEAIDRLGVFTEKWNIPSLDEEEILETHRNT